MNEQERIPSTSLVQFIENLAHILQASSVGELELTEGGTEIIIKRRPERGEAVPLSKQQTRSTQAQKGIAPNTVGEIDQSVAIVAPLTGVFYASPSPDSPPFVKVGDIIQPEQVVALIETMKVFNEIRADVTGRLTRVSVESGVVIKKGDTLFRVEPL